MGSPRRSFHGPKDCPINHLPFIYRPADSSPRVFRASRPRVQELDFRRHRGAQPEIVRHFRRGKPRVAAGRRPGHSPGVESAGPGRTEVRSGDPGDHGGRGSHRAGAGHEPDTRTGHRTERGRARGPADTKAPWSGGREGPRGPADGRSAGVSAAEVPPADVGGPEGGSSQPSGLMDLLAVAAVLVDGEGRIVLWSPQAEELYGYSPRRRSGSTRRRCSSTRSTGTW